MAVENLFNIQVGLTLNDNNLESQIKQIQEKLIKNSDIKLNIDFGSSLNNSLKEISNITTQIENLSKQVQGLNNNSRNIQVISTKNLATQINELKDFTGTIDQIKQKLSSLGDVKIKSGFVDDNSGIQNYVATLKKASGEIAQIKYKIASDMESTFSSKGIFGFDGIKSITDGTDKVLKNLDKFKSEYQEKINSIKDTGFSDNNSIDKFQKDLNDLNTSNFESKINEIKNSFKALDTQSKTSQENFANILKFQNEYQEKTDKLFSNDTLPKDKIINIEAKITGLNGNESETYLKSLENEFNKLIEEEKQLTQENIKYKNSIKETYDEQAKSIQYVYQQEERLKNIQSSYTNKLSTNSGSYDVLENEYKNIILDLENYKKVGTELNQEERNNVQTRINDLKRLSTEYLQINNFVQQQKEVLSGLQGKFKNVLNPNEIESYVSALKNFNPATDNLVGDFNKIIEKHKELKAELQERTRVSNLGENLGSTANTGLNMSSDVNEIQKYLKSTQSYKAQITSMKEEMDSLGNKVKEVNYSIANGNQVSKFKLNIDETSDSVRKMSLGMQDLSSKHAAFGEQIKQSIDGLLRFTVAGTALFGTLNQIKEGIATINELNKSQTNIAMVTGKDMGTVQQYTQEYAKLAAQLGDTTTSVSSAAEEFLRAGNSQKESMELVKASTIMSKESGQTQAESAQSLIATMNAYHMQAGDMMSVVDKMTKVDNESATSVAEMSTAINKVASSGQAAGVPLNNLISYIATISSVTRQSAGTVGTSLNSIFSRYESVKEGKQFDPDNNPLNNVEKSLNHLGISMRENNNTFKPFTDTLDTIAKKWSTLSQVEQAEVSTAMAG